MYARLQKGQDDIPTAYSPEDLDLWAQRAGTWASGLAPDDLPYADTNRPVEQQPRDVYVYFIHEGKVRAPQAAMAMQERCG